MYGFKEKQKRKRCLLALLTLIALLSLFAIISPASASAWGGWNWWHHPTPPPSSCTNPTPQVVEDEYVQGRFLYEVATGATDTVCKKSFFRRYICTQYVEYIKVYERLHCLTYRSGCCCTSTGACEFVSKKTWQVCEPAGTLEVSIWRKQPK